MIIKEFGACTDLVFWFLFSSLVQGIIWPIKKLRICLPCSSSFMKSADAAEQEEGIQIQILPAENSRGVRSSFCVKGIHYLRGVESSPKILTTELCFP